ncbi:MAG: hypothetical protein IJP86_05300 [Synergistaceae bacterium]|nr:hypothetical protein [Synergistaceae bacterium]
MPAFTLNISPELSDKLNDWSIQSNLPPQQLALELLQEYFDDCDDADRLEALIRSSEMKTYSIEVGFLGRLFGTKNTGIHVAFTLCFASLIIIFADMIHCYYNGSNANLDFISLIMPFFYTLFRLHFREREKGIDKAYQRLQKQKIAIHLNHKARTLPYLSVPAIDTFFTHKLLAIPSL